MKTRVRGVTHASQDKKWDCGEADGPRLLSPGGTAAFFSATTKFLPSAQPAFMQSPLQEILSQLSLTQEIRTSRLTLRPFRQDDLQVLSRLRAIPEVMQWTSQGRVDRDGETQAWMSMFIYEGDSSPRHNFNFVVILRGNPPEDASQPGFAEDQIIGVCGLTALDSLPVSPFLTLDTCFFQKHGGKATLPKL
ncbi:GNAT domain-containing protein [Penicillium chermesinum]|nr:GNAT domain-containing protein [Penicillium chermesinum]